MNPVSVAETGKQCRMDDGRNESEAERLDRNLSELLQGLRVAVTGVQVLLAFLLTVPFSARFDQTSTTQRWYLYAALVAAALATTCLIAPAAQHRVLFRRGQKALLVRRANVFGICGSVALLIAVGTAMLFVVDVLFGNPIAALTAVGISLVIAWTWLVQPVLTATSGR